MLDVVTVKKVRFCYKQPNNLELNEALIGGGRGLAFRYNTLIRSQRHHSRLPSFRQCLTSVGPDTFNLLLQFTDNLLATGFPFVAIFLGVVEVLFARNTKDIAVHELFGQGNNVKIEKANLTFVPELGRVRLGTALFIGLVHFLKETLVPLAVNVPMLHRVTHITGLDQMLNHNGGFAIPGSVEEVRW